MNFLYKGDSGAVGIAGRVALILAALCAPVLASSQERVAGSRGFLKNFEYPTSRGFAQPGLDSNLGASPLGLPAWQSALQEAASPRQNTKLGFATGVTVASIAVPLFLGGSTCRGSGNYLQICRLGFVGAAAVGGGLGALVGRMVESDGPPGPATTIMVGTAIGAVGSFLVSLPFCDQEEADNPELLCGYDGMVEAGTVMGGAVVGGILGFVFRGKSDGLVVSQLGPVPAPDGGSAFALAFTMTR